MPESTYAEARSIDAIVFIDGVEVPFTTINVNWAMSEMSQCRIAVEPDEIIDEWRPKAWVHVFVRDPFETVAPNERTEPAGQNAARDNETDLETYKLYWEGELVSIQDVESDKQRHTMLTAVDLWNIPAYAATDLVNIGSGLQVPFVNGSTFYGSLVGSEGLEPITAALIASVFHEDPEEVGELLGKDVLSRDVQEFVQRRDEDDDTPRVGPEQIAINILRYLGAYNAGYAIQLSRSDMLNKIAGITDKAVEQFLSLRFALMMAGEGQSIQAPTSVLDYVQVVISKFFYHYVTLPFPAPHRIDSTGAAQRGVSLYRSIAFMPNLYYALPPMCNYLFPDQYQVRDVMRNFMNEPTRVGLKSTALAAGIEITHLAPEWLTDFFGENQVAELGKSQELFQQAIFGTQDKPPENVVGERSVEELDLNEIGIGGSTNNLLRYLMPEEIEKGVLYQDDTNAYQEILGLAELNADSDVDDEGADGTKSAMGRYKQAVIRNEPYVKYMRLLAEYQLQFRKNSRTLRVIGPFNPWAVVGLPMLVLRQGRSYRGLLTQLAITIDYNGSAQSQYSLSYAQLLRHRTFEEQGTSYQEAVEAFQTAHRGLDTIEAQVRRLTELGGLTGEEREELATLSTSEKLTALENKQATLARRGDAIDAFMTEYRRRFNLFRYPLQDQESAPYAEDVLFGWLDYAGFIAGALGLGSSMDFGSSFANNILGSTFRSAVSAGAEFTELADIIDQALSDDAVLRDGSASSNGAVTSLITDIVMPLTRYVMNLVLAIEFTYQDRKRTFNTPGDRGFKEARPSGALQIRNAEEGIEEFEQASQRVVEELAELRGELEALNDLPDPTHIAEADNRVRLRTDLVRRIEELQERGTFIDAQIARERRIIAARQEIYPLDYRQVIAEHIRLEGMLSNIRAKHGTDTGHEIFGSVSSGFDLPLQFDDLPSRDVVDLIGLYRSDFSKSVGIPALAGLLELRSNWPKRPGSVAVEDPPPKSFDDFRNFNNIRGRDLISAVGEEFLTATDLRLAPVNQEQKKIEFDEAIEKIRSSYTKVQRFMTHSSLEIPPVMPFANDGVLDIALVDDALSAVVKPRNARHGQRVQDASGTYTSRADKVKAGTAIDVARLREFQVDITTETVTRYDEFLRLLRTIFPLGDDDQDTEYQRAKAQGVVHEWANNLQAREAVSLGDFLTINGLKLKVEPVVNFGITQMYYTMIDDENVGDRFTPLGARSLFSKFGANDKDLLKQHIDEIRERATSADASPEWRFMLSKTRQALIAAYTRRHLATAGFQGKR